jgi:hypothetical protein
MTKSKKINEYAPFDSAEEMYISWYLEELEEARFIQEYRLHPETFKLSPKQEYSITIEGPRKTTEKFYTLLGAHEYTPDFSIRWDYSAIGKFYKHVHINYPIVNKKKYMFWLCGELSIIDVKPMFDQNNMTRLFTINQKWLYAQQGVYVQKIIPQDLFQKTFTPERFLLTNKNKTKKKLDYTPRSLNEYLESLKVK